MARSENEKSGTLTSGSRSISILKTRTNFKPVFQFGANRKMRNLTLDGRLTASCFRYFSGSGGDGDLKTVQPQSCIKVCKHE